MVIKLTFYLGERETRRQRCGEIEREREREPWLYEVCGRGSVDGGKRGRRRCETAPKQRGKKLRAIIYLPSGKRGRLECRAAAEYRTSLLQSFSFFFPLSLLIFLLLFLASDSHSMKFFSRVCVHVTYSLLFLLRLLTLVRFLPFLLSLLDFLLPFIRRISLRVATVTATGTRIAHRVRAIYGKKVGQDERAEPAPRTYTLFIIRFVIHNAPLVVLLRYLLASQ